jgi:putative hydrolase of the HAD superfamily
MAISVIYFDIGNTLIAEKKWLPGSKEFVLKAKANGVRVGLISNTGDLDREQLSELLPADFGFDAFEEGLVLLSSEIGIEKPELGMFALAIQHTNVSPWEVMFVGESLTETIAAQKSGMSAARIVSPEEDYRELTKAFEFAERNRKELDE